MSRDEELRSLRRRLAAGDESAVEPLLETAAERPVHCLDPRAGLEGLAVLGIAMTLCGLEGAPADGAFHHAWTDQDELALPLGYFSGPETPRARCSCAACIYGVTRLVREAWAAFGQPTTGSGGEVMIVGGRPTTGQGGEIRLADPPRTPEEREG